MVARSLRRLAGRGDPAGRAGVPAVAAAVGRGAALVAQTRARPHRIARHIERSVRLAPGLARDVARVSALRMERPGRLFAVAPLLAHTLLHAAGPSAGERPRHCGPCTDRTVASACGLTCVMVDDRVSAFRVRGTAVTDRTVRSAHARRLGKSE